MEWNLAKEIILALRRRPEESQEELGIATDSIAPAPGNVFFERLNGLLREVGFDRFEEELVGPQYADGGRLASPRVCTSECCLSAVLRESIYCMALRGSVKTACRCEKCSV